MTSKLFAKQSMSFPTRVLTSGAFVVVALSLVAQGCAQESAKSGGTTGGTTGTGGGTPAGTGGAPSTASGGSNQPGTGGSSTSTGGSTQTGTGGVPATGTGGGSAGTGGATTGGGGTSGGPVCVSQAKAAPCLSPTDSCSKNCGPKSADNLPIGSKSLTCSGATYVEGLCTFPAGDYACFKVTAATAACPAATASGGACTVPSCMPCSGYTDSTMAPKAGYCHCVNSKWSCGSTKEWPCKADGTGSTSPSGTGC